MDSNPLTVVINAVAVLRGNLRRKNLIEPTLFIGFFLGVGTATNFRTAVYHGTEVRTAIRTAIYRVTCNCLAPRGCKHRAKYQSTCVNKHNYVRYSYLFCTIDDSFADLNLSDYLDTVFYTSLKMCK